MKRYWAMKWAKYLEQPYLRQAIGQLSTGNKTFSPKCCLGHAEYMVGNRFKKCSLDSEMWELERNERYSLSKETASTFDMATVIGEFRTPVLYKCRLFYSLSILNDAGMTLKKIAKVIRSRYKEL